MAANRNITLSLPAHVLRQLKRIAAQRQTSVSQLATQALADLAAREAGYAQAHARYLAWLAQAPDLGTQGHLLGPRAALHER
jgi:predicted transcriptional regulator